MTLKAIKVIFIDNVLVVFRYFTYMRRNYNKNIRALVSWYKTFWLLKGIFPLELGRLKSFLSSVKIDNSALTEG